MQEGLEEAASHPIEHGSLEGGGARVADVRVVQPGERLLQERALGGRPARREHLLEIGKARSDRVRQPNALLWAPGSTARRGADRNLVDRP